LSIRGINTGIAGNPSVGITIDDVPYGSSTNLGADRWFLISTPLISLDRGIPRGPQGPNPYGRQQSLGGLIKFVTVDPSTPDPTSPVAFKPGIAVSGVHTAQARGTGFGSG